MKLTKEVGKVMGLNPHFANISRFFRNIKEELHRHQSHIQRHL